MRREEREEGRKERDKETVIKMSNFGMTKEDISKCLGIDEKEVTKLINDESI